MTSTLTTSTNNTTLYRRSFLSSFDTPDLELLSPTTPSLMAANSNSSTTVKDLPPAVRALQEEARQLRDVLKLERIKYADTTLRDASSKMADVSLVAPVQTMKTRKILKYESKVISFDWSPDQRHIVSGGENGYAVVWDAFTSQKECVIETNAGWILSCAFSPSTTLVACGGLDKKVSIYELLQGEHKISSPKKMLAKHSRYITESVFLGSDQQLLTAGADGKINLWDMESNDPIQEYVGHESEVMGIDIQKSNPYSVFASCGNDCCACIWDIRSGKCVTRINEFNSELNSIKFFPTGDAIATAATDGSVHLFDLRADQEIKLYNKPTILLSASSLDFSTSGRLLFVGYDDYTLRAWDVLKGVQLMAWYDHEDRISQVKVSDDGTAVGTCSWDGTVRVWA